MATNPSWHPTLSRLLWVGHDKGITHNGLAHSCRVGSSHAQTACRRSHRCGARGSGSLSAASASPSQSDTSPAAGRPDFEGGVGVRCKSHVGWRCRVLSGLAWARGGVQDPQPSLIAMPRARNRRGRIRFSLLLRRPLCALGRCPSIRRRRWDLNPRIGVLQNPAPAFTTPARLSPDSV